MPLKAWRGNTLPFPPLSICSLTSAILHYDSCVFKGGRMSVIGRDVMERGAPPRGWEAPSAGEVRESPSHTDMSAWTAASSHNRPEAARSAAAQPSTDFPLDVSPLYSWIQTNTTWGFACAMWDYHWTTLAPHYTPTVFQKNKKHTLPPHPRAWHFYKDAAMRGGEADAHRGGMELLPLLSGSSSLLVDPFFWL
ncbi:hypothetical protein EYF80_007405 [Liparis tanakae]|uniref:Uncharacterized protein n=1 Tax=Liparis tanakae TaxID=230148 RepID=A0A4Z2IXM5_9TELE|nr:hypothetical protein EYF80_007405 [Liparis tanakae]